MVGGTISASYDKPCKKNEKQELAGDILEELGVNLLETNRGGHLDRDCLRSSQTLDFSDFVNSVLNGSGEHEQVRNKNLSAKKCCPRIVKTGWSSVRRNMSSWTAPGFPIF